MKNFRRILNFLMLIAFLLAVVTGIIKFPQLHGLLGFVSVYIPVSIISYIHDWSGLVLVMMIIVHLFLNWKFFLSMGEKGRKVTKIIGIIILIALLICVAVFFVSRFLQQNQPLKLSSVEVKDYNGQRLDSINSVVDNAINGTQYINKNTYKLEISGLVQNPKSYSYDEVLEFPKYQKVVQLNCVEGWSSKILWEGVLLKDIFKDLSVKTEANTVIFYAADGYSTSLPLDYIMNNNIMLAYKMNGVVLPPEKGFPFQLVAEQKWGYKWIKWITKIELSNDTNYKGYWESRGYNNNGDVNGSQFAK